MTLIFGLRVNYFINVPFMYFLYMSSIVIFTFITLRINSLIVIPEIADVSSFSHWMSFTRGVFLTLGKVGSWLVTDELLATNLTVYEINGSLRIDGEFSLATASLIFSIIFFETLGFTLF